MTTSVRFVPCVTCRTCSSVCGNRNQPGGRCEEGQGKIPTTFFSSRPQRNHQVVLPFQPFSASTDFISILTLYLTVFFSTPLTYWPSRLNVSCETMKLVLNYMDDDFKSYSFVTTVNIAIKIQCHNRKSLIVSHIKYG